MNLKAEIFRISISHYVEIVLLFLYLQYFAGDVAQVGYQGVVMLTLWITFFFAKSILYISVCVQ